MTKRLLMVWIAYGVVVLLFAAGVLWAAFDVHGRSPLLMPMTGLVLLCRFAWKMAIRHRR